MKLLPGVTPFEPAHVERLREHKEGAGTDGILRINQLFSDRPPVCLI